MSPVEETPLEQGLAALTIEGVAARAGVGKATIYRRWPSKGALAFDAVLDEYLAAQPVPDTGSFEADLLATIRIWIQAAARRRGGRTLADLIAEVQSDPILAAAWRDRFVRPLRQTRHQLVERAIARGEIPAGSDPQLLLDLTYGPLYHRYLNGHLPLDDAFAQALARAVAAAGAAGAAVPGPQSASASR